MAQSDQVVQNATFPAVRADINDNLAALYSQSSGASAPSVTVAFQPWVDTSVSPPLWKIRNASNTNWITVGTLDVNFAAGGVTPIANGGTGATTSTGAINALVPSQAGNADKYLKTNGSVVSWAPAGSVVYEFTVNDTWAKPSEGTLALVSIWGGGGSGGSQVRAGGGGGGACVQRLYRLSELPSTVAITIAAGGASRASNGNGFTGGTTTFGSLLSAYGGGGGDAQSVGFSNGGGGGGSLGAGTTSTGGIGHGPALTGGNPASVSGYGADFGGAAGGAGVSATTLTNESGGNAYWGGAGGAGRTDASSKAGGVSLHGGNGGAGNSTATGGFPGGGSGGTGGVTGAGGAGYCLIYVW